jgi:hypothetical protein
MGYILTWASNIVTAQEQDALSDIDFESDDEMDEDDAEEGANGDAPPNKKRKA